MITEKQIEIMMSRMQGANYAEVAREIEKNCNKQVLGIVRPLTLYILHDLEEIVSGTTQETLRVKVREAIYE